jgi:hypothetical protein
VIFSQKGGGAYGGKRTQYLAEKLDTFLLVTTLALELSSLY